MSKKEAEVCEGLEDIIPLETEIAYIDGIAGVLEYRGYKIKDLAELTYDFIAYLLLFGTKPTKIELENFTKDLRKNREIDDPTEEILHVCNFNVEAMDVLRTAISYMAHCDVDLNDNSVEANRRKAIKLIAKIPTIVAAFHRVINGKSLVRPDPKLPRGENFLYMLKGERPTPLEAELMEKDFIVSAEHELNASTFAVRVAASTLSDLHSAIITGIGTLKGTLHGGARLAVMKMLDDVPSAEKAEAYVQNKIAKHERIMGFGHRVYKTYDPRSQIIKALVKVLAKEKDNLKWLDIAESIEKTVIKELVEKRGKPIYPNVDFYSAVSYKYLKLPAQLATAIFVNGRISGWIAHYLEQQSNNKLIRPRALYVGEHDLEVK